MPIHHSILAPSETKSNLIGRGLQGGPLAGVAPLLQQLGAIAAGVVRCGPMPAWLSQRYRDWLMSGHAAQMAYLSRHLDARLDPSNGQLLPGATIILCVAFPYADGAQHSGLWSLLARHARGRDYHATLRERLSVVVRELRQQLPQGRFRVIVDTAPALERSLAVACGLGSIGRSGMLLVPGIGPRVLLGEIVCAGVSAEAACAMPQHEERAFSVCGTCRACCDACPTGALLEDGMVDARRCLSYWTIEATDDESPAPAAGAQLFGCDVCTEACPRCAPVASTLEPMAASGLDTLSLEQLQSASDEELARMIHGTALERGGVARLRRSARALYRPFTKP